MLHSSSIHPCEYIHVINLCCLLVRLEFIVLFYLLQPSPDQWRLFDVILLLKLHVSQSNGCMYMYMVFADLFRV